MKQIPISEVEPSTFGNDIDRRGLSEPLGTTDVAINHYRITSGEGLPGGIHAHMDQEEVFVIVNGEAIFETMDAKIVVGAGEAIRFAPGEFQSGKNNSDDELVMFAMGAPRDTEDERIPIECLDCGHDDLRLSTGGTDLTFVCPDCGAEYVPQACPECGSDDMRITLDKNTQTIVVCHVCDAEFEYPPLRS
jgi:uncharacterized cupin superfamily protein